MADQPQRTAGGGESETRHLDALGPREVVYCHQCDNEWFNDEHGLTCPRCHGESTEIVTPESDPRPIVSANPPIPNYNTRPDLFGNPNHNPWDDSDPEEADIEEHVTHGPGGSVLISRTIRSTGPRSRRNRQEQGDPNETVRNFQQMLGTLMGPGFRPGQPGTSGPDTLFTQGPFGGRPRAGVAEQQGQRVFGGRFTYTTGNLQPGSAGGGDIHSAPVDDLASFISSIFGPQPTLEGQGGRGGVPPGIQGLLAALLNPANARSGDAVYTQEALDRIISNLMDQHTSSNTPGPATAEAIAALPKKKLDEKMLGPEGSGECSVCMDDVFIGVEVVVLPCTHWFHQECANAWLKEHNTCPICRKGIEGETPSSNTRQENQNASSSSYSLQLEQRNQRLSHSRPGYPGPGMNWEDRRESTAATNRTRLDAIRNLAGLSSIVDSNGTNRGRVGGRPENPGGYSGGYSRSWGTGRSDGAAANNASWDRALPSRPARNSNVNLSNSAVRAGSRANNNSGSRHGDSSDRARATAGSSGGSSSPVQGITSWIRDRWSSNSSNRRQD